MGTQRGTKTLVPQKRSYSPEGTIEGFSFAAVALIWSLRRRARPPMWDHLKNKGLRVFQCATLFVMQKSCSKHECTKRPSRFVNRK